MIESVIKLSCSLCRLGAPPSSGEKWEAGASASGVGGMCPLGRNEACGQRWGPWGRMRSVERDEESGEECGKFGGIWPVGPDEVLGEGSKPWGGMGPAARKGVWEMSECWRQIALGDEYMLYKLYLSRDRHICLLLFEECRYQTECKR